MNYTGWIAVAIAVLQIVKESMGSVQNFSHILQQPIGEAWFRIEPRKL